MWSENRTGWCLGLLLVLVHVCHEVSANNEILGCGGFIKTHAAIDFSKIEIKL